MNSSTNRVFALKAFGNKGLQGIRRDIYATVGFTQNGIKFETILSSQWCRCLETARLLDLGDVSPEGSLNSGFKGLFKQEETLTKLRRNLEALINKQELVLMVTHSGVISAITGLNVKSSGAVAYDTITGESRIILIK